ncbi:MAG TPA: sigma-54-dependent Fis family transcriptional regulator [candidate division WOR-3 bacterium]|uniref:Sigma-54-dependent Fis family transcriptional regulator n=1 Tax=candidate division WOR-3 bacterium TaxID=2052148 RepID=A0A7V5HQI3_UNCW3|nr:sigma-54-dependent Fis family transcriptional regulator [candidate division WOR-3 bacterium]
MSKILIIEDEGSQRMLLREFLEERGYTVDEAETGEKGIEKVKKVAFDVVLIDIRLPDISGIEVLRKIRMINPEIKAVMITAFQDVKLVVESLKGGAFNYLVKPINLEELLINIRKAQENLRLEREVKVLRTIVRSERLKGIVAESYAMKQVVDIAVRVADSPSSVLITGESGTGKELIARLIHEKSQRKNAPFIAVNLAAIPESLIESELFGYEKGAFTGADREKPGLIEKAHGGTIFLDEIGELPLPLQVKLLRIIEEKEIQRLGGLRAKKVDFRLITATNRNLEEMVKAGTFRDDLFYRINVIHIHIPPLRERKEDIPYLLEHFLKIYSAREAKKIKGFTKEAYELLLRYHYPGNVRELENIVERAVVLSQGEYITTEELPLSLRKEIFPQEQEFLTLNERIEAIERSIILEALKKNNWVKTKAARELGISERVLRYKMKKLGIKENKE